MKILFAVLILSTVLCFLAGCGDTTKTTTIVPPPVNNTTTNNTNTTTTTTTTTTDSNNPVNITLPAPAPASE